MLKPEFMHWTMEGEALEAANHTEPRPIAVVIMGNPRFTEDPKIQGNPLNLPRHTLIRHGSTELPDVPRDFDGLKDFLKDFPHEGVVWHHPDGRMVKIKRKDFWR